MTRFMVLVLALLATGCARWTVNRIKPEPNDATDDQIKDAPEGLRFYAPELYYWILPASGGGCTATPVYLPNPKKVYLLRTAGLGSTTIHPTLDNGWNLTQFEGTTDTQTAEVLNAVGSIIGGLAGAIPGGTLRADMGATKVKPLGLGFYHPETNDQGIISDLKLVKALTDSDGNPLQCPPFAK